MPTFTPSSNLSSFYGGRMAPPIRLPNGTLIPAPNTMSVDEMYRGIYPASLSAPTAPTAPSTPLVSRSVNTVPIDPTTGNPFTGFRANPMTATQQSGARPAYTVGTQPAGTVQMPPGVRPGSIDEAYAQIDQQLYGKPGQTGRGLPAGFQGNGMVASLHPGFSSQTPIQTAQSSGTVYDPFNPNTPKFQDRLPSNDGGEGGFLTAFGPQAPANPAVSAIDNAAGMPPMPRIRPIPPAQIPLTSLTRPSGGSVPQMPAPITFRKGDTVGKLAKARGMTISSFSDLYGIANPNKIYAGQTVSPQAPAMPRTPTFAQRTPPQSTRDRQLSEGRATLLDEFGMIR